MRIPHHAEDITTLRVVDYLLSRDECLDLELVKRLVALHWLEQHSSDPNGYRLTAEGERRVGP